MALCLRQPNLKTSMSKFSRVLADFRADFRRTHAKSSGGTVGRFVSTMRAPGFHAVFAYRLGQLAQTLPVWLRWPLDILYLVLNAMVKMAWGIELPRRARLGGGLYIGHFGGIIVSPRAHSGRNLTLSQGVTIGMAGDGEQAGAPTLGDDVYIGPGAKVFGKIHIGNNVKIGANAVIHKDLPDDAVAALSPGFVILSQKGNRRD